MKFNSVLFDEYKRLGSKLESDKYILQLINKKKELYDRIQLLDNYSSEFKEVKSLYDEVTASLINHEEYARFKMVERELNLFIMYCNKELDKLFDLDKSGCSK